MAQYFVYDVFTNTAFGGNQLAVFPDATSLAEGDLQKIAAEFNFSEVTFVYPPASPEHRAKVRIFTPTMEVPFAGHPIIGTAVALADIGPAGEITLELDVGPVPCQAEDGHAQFTTSSSLELVGQPSIVLVAQALGLSTDQIKTTTHVPTLCGVGLPFTVTELTDREALAEITTDVAAFRQGAKAFPTSLDFAQFAYYREGNEVHARMFAPLDNIPEDPATGSASAALGALLKHVLKAEQELTIFQGVDMGRPSKISLRTQGDGITIAGDAKRVMQGQLVY